jgi:hypothetical protein
MSRVKLSIIPVLGVPLGTVISFLRQMQSHWSWGMESDPSNDGSQVHSNHPAEAAKVAGRLPKSMLCSTQSTDRSLPQTLLKNVFGGYKLSWCAIRNQTRRLLRQGYEFRGMSDSSPRPYAT